MEYIWLVRNFSPPLLKVMRREKFGLVHLLQTERKRRRCHLLRSIGRAAPPLLCRPQCLSRLLSLSFRKEGDGSNPTIFDDFSRSLLAFKSRVSPSRDHRYPNTVFSGVIGFLIGSLRGPFTRIAALVGPSITLICRMHIFPSAVHVFCSIRFLWRATKLQSINLDIDGFFDIQVAHWPLLDSLAAAFRLTRPHFLQLRLNLMCCNLRSRQGQRNNGKSQSTLPLKRVPTPADDADR